MSRICLFPLEQGPLRPSAYGWNIQLQCLAWEHSFWGKYSAARTRIVYKHQGKITKPTRRCKLQVSAANFLVCGLLMLYFSVPSDTGFSTLQHDFVRYQVRWRHQTQRIGKPEVSVGETQATGRLCWRAVDLPYVGFCWISSVGRLK